MTCTESSFVVLPSPRITAIDLSLSSRTLDPREGTGKDWKSEEERGPGTDTAGGRESEGGACGEDKGRTGTGRGMDVRLKRREKGGK